MAVSKRMRFEVLRRDGYRCRYCGKNAQQSELQLDHVIPVTLGGADDPSNLVTSCSDCNAGKSSVPPDAEQVPEVNMDALRWTEAIQAAAKKRRGGWEDMETLTCCFEDKWERFTYSGPHCTPHQTVPLPRGYERSIEQFVKNGLDLDDMYKFVDDAMACPVAAQYKWKSFCKRCWSEIKLRQDIATLIVSEEREGQL